MTDLIPKQQKKPVFGQMFFLIVSTAIFVSIVAAFVVLQQLTKEAKSTLDSLEIIFAEDTRPREKQLEAELNQYQARLTDLQTILDQRMNLLAFFELLERTTHPEVFFFSLTGNVESRDMVLEGEASSFFDLEQQRLAWKNRPELEKALLEDIGIVEDGTRGFGAQFIVSKEFLEPR